MADIQQHDVIIIGAGMSGLRAAQLLADTHDVCVIEARDRVGGRALAHRFENGDTVDIGGQWVGPGQDRLYALINEMGMMTYPLWDQGDRLMLSRDRLSKYTGTIPKLAPHILLNVHWMMTRFDKMAAQIDPARPWAHPRAQEWDSQTVAEWMRKHALYRRAFEVFAVGIGAVFAAEPHDVSLLHALFYARAGTSLDNLVSTTGGAQQDRVHGDMAGLATRIADSLGDRVRLNEPVRKIDWSDGLRVETDRAIHHARRGIMAIPPSQAMRIRYEPDLPAGRAGLWLRMPPGACIKCIAQYETPFWREEGLAGQAVGPELTVRVTFDNTQEGKTAGQLLGFIEGSEARQWSGRDPEERKAAVLRAFSAYFNETALHPIDYVDQDWTAEPFTRGCYAALMGPGVWTAYGEHLRQPLGPLHMAGTETATAYFGYYEGALDAAERAVAEVTRALEAG
ncbi:flavin monoamine oxidase family protein [Maricaulis alexandrii]|uniref:flavin monoamine oxidase family protein n=1 Tax=Maricaulis alexandrii TaxID=2570354 RepID=UPI001107AB19|nr:FAD-dependent oxidoreductase [Maricaulis alexandrii]